MKSLLIKRSIVLIFMFSLAYPAFPDHCNGTVDNNIFTGKASGELFSMQKKAKVKKAPSAKNAQKQADKKEKKKDKDYADFVKYNRKRSQEIQTPEVRERMQQNVKDANANYKAKKKSNSDRTKKGARKYK